MFCQNKIFIINEYNLYSIYKFKFIKKMEFVYYINTHLVIIIFLSMKKIFKTDLIELLK